MATTSVKKYAYGKTKAQLRRQTSQVIEGLSTEYPEAECALDHETPAQLLFATILSAQCTDVMVNKVTKTLFQKWPDPESLAKARVSEIEKVVKPTGFYKNKAKNLKACATALVKEHRGEVPRELEALTALAGVGRKTANVVRGNAFGIPGMVVDTHVKRICNLIGLTEESDPVKIEYELMEIVRKEDWTMFSHWIIHHGRAICIARRPKCTECVIRRLCDYGKKQID